MRGQIDPGLSDAGHQVRHRRLGLIQPQHGSAECIQKALMSFFLLPLVSLTKAEDFFSEKYQTGLPFTHLEVMLGKLA